MVRLKIVKLKIISFKGDLSCSDFKQSVHVRV